MKDPDLSLKWTLKEPLMSVQLCPMSIASTACASNEDCTNTQYQDQIDVFARISNYTLVNSLVQGYTSLKHSNRFFKAGLETAESSTQKLISFSRGYLPKQPNSTATTTTATHSTTTSTVTSTTSVTSGVMSAITVRLLNSTESLIVNILPPKLLNDLSVPLESHSTLSATSEGLTTHTLHTTTEPTTSTSPSFLPPTSSPMAVSPTRSFAYNYSSSSAGSSPTSSSSSTCSSSSPSSPSSTPSSTHSPSSLLLLRSSVNMACQAQMNVIAFVVDLIQYASEYMDIIIQKNLSEGAGGEGETRGEHSPQSRGSPPTTLRSSTGVQRSLGSTTPSSPRSTSPHFRSVRWYIESQMIEVGNHRVKATIAIVTAIIHSIKTLKSLFNQQILGNIEAETDADKRTTTLSRLHKSLTKLTNTAKIAIMALSESELSAYISKVVTSVKPILQSLVDLTRAFAPSLLLTSTTGSSPSTSPSPSSGASGAASSGYMHLLNRVPVVFVQLFTAISSWRNSLTLKIADNEPLFKRVLISKTSTFDSIISEQYRSDRINIVYVTAAIDPASGDTWCTDCKKALMIIPSLYDIPNLTIFECQVDREEYVNNPSHPYRTHPLLSIKRVPTLIHWTDNGPEKKLVESELHSYVNISEFKRYLLQYHGYSDAEFVNSSPAAPDSGTSTPPITPIDIPRVRSVESFSESDEQIEDFLVQTTEDAPFCEDC